MAFTADEISDINYYLGNPARADYIAKITELLVAAIAASPSAEVRIRENLREVKRVEQQIKEGRNTFGTLMEPGKRMSSDQRQAMLADEALRFVTLIAQDAQLLVQRNVFSHHFSGRLTRG